jgi:hypothetical protein
MSKPKTVGSELGDSVFALSPEEYEFARLFRAMDVRRQRILSQVTKRLHREQGRGQCKFTERFWQMPVRHGWLDDMEALLREIPETDG